MRFMSEQLDDLSNLSDEEIERRYKEIRKQRIAEFKKAIPDLRVEAEYWDLQYKIKSSQHGLFLIQQEKINYELQVQRAKEEADKEGVDKDTIPVSDDSRETENKKTVGE